MLLKFFKFNNLELALGIALKFYTSVEEGLKLKVRKIWGLIPTTGRGGGLPPILNRAKCSLSIFLLF